MKPFIIPIEKTICGRIATAKLNNTETDVRLYILEHFRNEGKAPSLKRMTTSIPNMSMFQVMPILEKLASNDIINIKDNKILVSYPFSNAPTNFVVEFKKDSMQCYALCATDALGIPFMYGEDVIIHTRCHSCEREIIIDIENQKAKNIEPDKVVEFASYPTQNCSSSESVCPFLNFFCCEEHASIWAEKNPEHANGEIYTIDIGLGHGREIFENLLLAL